MTYKILVVVTEDSPSCVKAINNVREAIVNSKDIILEVVDYHKLSRKFVITNKIKEYPAVIYMIEESVVHTSFGALPTVIYTHWIKMYF